MKTADLVDSLCTDLEAIQPAYSPRSRLALVWPLTVLYTLGLVALTGSFRPDIMVQLTSSPRLLAESVLGLIAALVAAYAAFESMVPGIRWSTKRKLLVLVPTLIFLAFSLYSLFVPAITPSWSGWRPGCETEIVLYGIVPVLTCFVIALRSAPTNAGWTGLLVGIASFTPAAVIMNLACAYDPVHVIFYHILPVGMVSLASLFYGKSFFKV